MNAGVPRKRYAPACARNSEPILTVLRQMMPARGRVLEIGSGTGQHAVYFAAHLPELEWQPTDVGDMLTSIEAWRADSGLSNVRAPRQLDLMSGPWPDEPVDAMVCINTVHIVGWPAVESLFAGAGHHLAAGGVLFLYGPFRYRGRELEPSNRGFDAMLRQRDPASGIREFEALDELAARAGLQCAGDVAMPANNRSIWWRRQD